MNVSVGFQVFLRPYLTQAGAFEALEGSRVLLVRTCLLRGGRLPPRPGGLPGFQVSCFCSLPSFVLSTGLSGNSVLLFINPKLQRVH